MTRGLLSDERGAVLPLAVLMLIVLLGMAALAVDLGLLFAARSDAQNAADAAALAGGGVLAETPGAVTAAYQEAADYVARHPVAGDTVHLPASDFVYEPDSSTVTVTVRRTEGSGNPVHTVFGKAVGLDRVDIGATATVRIARARGVRCMLPIAIPDRWHDVGTEYWNPDEGDYYTPVPEPGHTSYTVEHIGQEVVLLPAGPGQGGNQGGDQGGPNTPTGRGPRGFTPGWWGWWGPVAQADLAAWTAGCPDEDVTTWLDDWDDQVKGRHENAVRQGFQALIDQDPDATWDPSCKCVVGGQGMESPRIKPVLMFDPRTVEDRQVDDFQFVNMGAVFVQEVEGRGAANGRVTGRLMNLDNFQLVTGDGDDASAAGGEGSLASVLRIIR